jgi:ligand-binding sensor domain-containing protein
MGTDSSAFRMTTRISILCALLLAAVTLSAQSTISLSDWQTFSTMRTVRAASVDSKGRIWAATPGGLFVYSAADSSIQEYRNVGALLNLDVTAILCDTASKRVFVGCFDGSLTIVTEDLQFKNITDIRRATVYQRRRINDFLLKNGLLYIATDFGIVSFDPANDVFRETVDRIGPLQEKTRVTSLATLRDSIWASTDSGIVVAPLSSETLRLPSVWKFFGTSNGIPVPAVSFVRATDTDVYATAGGAILIAEGSSFRAVYSGGATLVGLTTTATEIYASEESFVRTLSGPLPVSFPGQVNGHATTSRNGRTVVIAFVVNLPLAIVDGTDRQDVYVNSPRTNQFSHLTIDRDGWLWSATDEEPFRTGQGVMAFDGNTWYEFTKEANTEMGSNSYHRVNAQPDGSVWLSSWGYGIVEAKKVNGGVVLQKWNNTNSPLVGISADANYVVTSDAITDRNGKLWIVNELGADRLLVTRDKDQNFGYFKNCYDLRANQYRVIAIDNGGTKWMAGPTGNGLLAFNDKNTPSNEADDVCQMLRSSNTQLQDNVIRALRVDKNGALWIGTARGVSVIASPSTVSNSSIPFVRRITALSALNVNDIFVDAVNNKWIATSNGVYVLNEDGTEVLSIITQNNSPLLTDNVKSVVVDDRTGRAYFGTMSGCSSVLTQSVKPLDAYAIRCYPQPFRPDADGTITIDGLAADSDVRIMTAAGELVAAVQTSGRQALWNGKDVQGRTVPPGVYIIHALSASTKEAAVGKLAVTR